MAWGRREHARRVRRVRRTPTAHHATHHTQTVAPRRGGSACGLRVVCTGAQARSEDDPPPLLRRVARASSPRGVRSCLPLRGPGRGGTPGRRVRRVRRTSTAHGHGTPRDPPGASRSTRRGGARPQRVTLRGGRTVGHACICVASRQVRTRWRGAGHDALAATDRRMEARWGGASGAQVWRSHAGDHPSRGLTCAGSAMRSREARTILRRVARASSPRARRSCLPPRRLGRDIVRGMGHLSCVCRWGATPLRHTATAHRATGQAQAVAPRWGGSAWPVDLLTRRVANPSSHQRLMHCCCSRNCGA